MKKTIRCPKCNYTITVEGSPGEVKYIICPNCGSKGRFVFPENRDFRIPEKRKVRPLGVTILAALQIIGVISAIISLMMISTISSKSMQLIEEFVGFPVIVFLVIYSMVLMPVALVLAYGLLKGEEWARLTSVLFQIVSIISSILSFNIFGIIIPIIIIHYLRKPHVKYYFEAEKGLRTNTKAVLIAIVIILLIFNSYIALMINPINIYRGINRISNERYYYGTWENETQDIEITFYRNESFFIENGTDSYWGKWSTGGPFWVLKLKWMGGEGTYMSFFMDGGTIMSLEKSDGQSGFFSSIELKKKAEL